jgi:hypothetical protein
MNFFGKLLLNKISFLNLFNHINIGVQLPKECYRWHVLKLETPWMILDGHGSHVNMEVITRTKEMGFDLLIFLSHKSHVL